MEEQLVDIPVFKNELLNRIIADLIKLHELLKADHTDQTAPTEKSIGLRTKYVFEHQEEFDKEELVAFCYEYMKHHQQVVLLINSMKKEIEDSQKNKKITATKIYKYNQMNNLRY